jgi:hypothetical protein
MKLSTSSTKLEAEHLVIVCHGERSANSLGPVPSEADVQLKRPNEQNEMDWLCK